jgi:hypothetical protein
MDTFKLSNGRSVAMDAFTGEVIESSRSQAIAIEQGAATVLSPNLVIPGQLSSRINDTTAVWLRSADGREKQFDLHNMGLPMRTGHRVSVLWTGPEIGRPGWFIGARNHTTQETKVALMAGAGSNAREFKLDTGGNLTLALIFLGFVVLGAVVGLFVSDSREIAQRLVIGGLFGFLASLLLGIPVIQMVGGSLARRAVDEIEAHGVHYLAARDST